MPLYLRDDGLARAGRLSSRFLVMSNDRNGAGPKHIMMRRDPADAELYHRNWAGMVASTIRPAADGEALFDRWGQRQGCG